MNSSRGGKGLSLRLSYLRSIYQQEHHIWDIGCDHGHLGLSFISEPHVEMIHFVDPSKLVIEELTKKVGAYISMGKIDIQHKKGQDLEINNKNNFIIIAGMGGEEVGDIIQNILPQLDKDSRIVISPHRKILELRHLLSKLPIFLRNESVIRENGQFYQILELTPGNGTQKVSLYGDQLWESDLGKEYLEHELSYIKYHRDVASQAYGEYLKSTYAMKFSKD